MKDITVVSEASEFLGKVAFQRNSVDLFFCLWRYDCPADSSLIECTLIESYLYFSILELFDIKYLNGFR